MKLNVPFYKQDKTYTCGPVALQMVFSLLGKFKSEAHLAKEAGTNKSDGTSHEGMINTALREKFHCYVNEGSSLDEVKFFINLGFPAIVDYTEPSGDDGHYAVAFGHEDGHIILNDPWNGKDFKLTDKEFISRWYDHHHNGNRCERWIMVISREGINLGKQYAPKINK